jgi:hypothetical protein
MVTPSSRLFVITDGKNRLKRETPFQFRMTTAMVGEGFTGCYFRGFINGLLRIRLIQTMAMPVTI